MPLSSYGLVAAMSLAAPATAIAQDDEWSPTGRAWEDMDYGPFLSTCIEYEEGRFAYKGIAVRVDGTEGGVARGGQWMLFDTDTLAWVTGWDGRFIDWRSIVYDGSHQTHAKLAGRRGFVAPEGAGWARPGTTDFDAPRTEGRDGKDYGPIPREWAQYRGLWRQDGPPILHSTVGATEVFERAGRIEVGGQVGFVRELTIGPRAVELNTRILKIDGDLRFTAELDGMATAVVRRGLGETSAPKASESSFDGSFAYQLNATDVGFQDGDFSVRVRFRTTKGGTLVARTAASNEWVPDGTTLFVRGGKVCYDIGWVGVLSSRHPVADGEWHEVMLTFDQFEGLARLYVDGEESGQKELRREQFRPSHVVRVGHTAQNFPKPSPFQGEIAEVQFFDQLVDPEDPASAPAAATLRPVEGGGFAQVGADRPLERYATQGSAASAGPARASTVVIVQGEGSWLRELDGSLVLGVAEGEAPVSGRVIVLPIDDDSALEDVDLQAALDRLGPPADLAAACRPTQAQWPQTLRTETETLGDADAAYVVDDFSAPLDNPYRSWFRVGGFDFSEDGDRAAVATWMGDVWWVSGLSDPGEGLSWRRFAAGLYQPLGLCLEGDTVYVVCRDQVARLKDVDGDGEADHYECFNNDHQVTEHFHEFAMALQRDADGNFYFMKGACHARDCLVPHHGTLIKLSPDGKRSEIVAQGFRAPNGLSIAADGAFYSSDQEGHWTPANRLNRIVPGGFYGYRWAYVPEEEMPEVGEYEAPLCWVDHDFDISPAEQLEVEGSRWGPLEGQLISLSYGTGQVALVLREKVGEVWQGAVSRLPIATFPTGIMRGRFHPRDGQLYVSGLFGWSSRRTLPGGLYRIRWNEQEDTQLPTAFHATEEGLVLRFEQPLDADRCARSGAWELRRWNYKYAQRYGSDDFRVSDGEKGREDVVVESVKISPDGRAVLLKIADFQPCHQMSVQGRLRTAAGERYSPELYMTIHAIGDFAPYAAWFE